MNQIPAESDRNVQLLKQWRDGDREALKQLLSELQPWLHVEMSKALAGRARGVQDSLDFAQTAVAEFLSFGPKFVPETEAQFRALVKRVAMNGLFDEQRRRAVRERGPHLESLGMASSLTGFVPAAISTQRPSREAERSENQAWVRLALQFLEPEERYLLLASEVEGVDWSTIAAELGLGNGDVARMRCARLKPRLARMLQQLRRGKTPDVQ